MFRSWRLGTAFGINIFVHWSFAILPIWVLFEHWGNAVRVAVALAFIAALFSFVVLHELGHALAARYFGIQTRDITLYPIGGVARLERMSEKPWEELCIALAGPVVNAGLAVLLLLATVLAFLFWNTGGGLVTAALVTGNAEAVGLDIVTFLGGLALANVVLGVFNLLPAFPMDGGRVLRALLAMRMSRLRATEIAANIGAGLALLLALLGLAGGGLMMFLVAAFVFLAGRQELFMLRHREFMKQMAPEPPTAEEPEISPVAPTAIPERFTGILWDGQARVWVVWQDGRPVGTIGGRRPE
jgi:Zn-dependent protease